MRSCSGIIRGSSSYCACKVTSVLIPGHVCTPVKTVAHSWMTAHHLKLNPSKTELLFIPSTTGPHCDLAISFGNSFITPTEDAGSLGVILDGQLLFSAHIANLTRSCRFLLYTIRRIRPFLSQEATQLLVQSLVISRLDYCNSLLAGLPLWAIRPLQLVQNAAARLIFNLPKFTHVTPLLRSLHWLPVVACIRFKTLRPTKPRMDQRLPPYGDGEESSCTSSPLCFKYSSTRSAIPEDSWKTSVQTRLCPGSQMVLAPVRAVSELVTLLHVRNQPNNTVNDELRETLRGFGLLRQPAPQIAASSEASSRKRGRRKRCARLQKRGKRAGVRTRLTTKPTRAALPSILLSNVCSLENKLDCIRLQRTTQRESRDCCVFVFTETWLSDRVPAAAIQLDGLASFRADRDSALCVLIISVYIPPGATAKAALCELYSAISGLQNTHPDGLFIVAGDFNHVNLKSVLPKFHQHVNLAVMVGRETPMIFSAVLTTSCSTAWFGNCTASDRKSLQRVVRTAEKIIGVSLPTITDIYTTRCIRKATSIVDDHTHPSHTLFTTHTPHTHSSPSYHLEKGTLGPGAGNVVFVSTVYCSRSHWYMGFGEWTTQNPRTKGSPPAQDKGAAFRSGDQEAHSFARVSLRGGISEAKHRYRQRTEEHFDSPDPDICGKAYHVPNAPPSLTNSTPSTLASPGKTSNRSTEDSISTAQHTLLTRLDDDTTVIGLIRDDDETAYRDEVQHINGAVVERVSGVRFWGFHISDDLSLSIDS
ncbi:hypothetical protein NFI96_006694 [Prochilodus magdalenae]|nr:hypothetical protein NFI96_006694 [Prochilodus magdalenae]